jgi:glutathione peroxidase
LLPSKKKKCQLSISKRGEKKMKSKSQTTNLAMSRYLIVIVVFIILAFVALFTEREHLFGSKKGRKNKITSQHLSYGSDDPLSSDDKIPRTPIPFKNYNLEKNKYNDENEKLQKLEASSCLVYAHNENQEPLELIDVVEMSADHEHDESEKQREKTVDLAKEYFGKVTLYVNVASRCGFTDVGYKALVKLYEKFEDEHNLEHNNNKKHYKHQFRIAAVPSNDFGKQEPGTIDQIRHFAFHKYGAKFHIYQKASVHGAEAIPLFRKLARCSPETLNSKNNVIPAEVTWNWNFFLVDRMGRVVARFPPGTDASKMAEVIEPLLQD